MASGDSSDFKQACLAMEFSLLNKINVPQKSEVITEAHALCKSIVEGDYEAVLTHPLSQRILDPGEDPSKQLEDIIIDNVSKAVAEENSPNISERQLCILAVGVAALQLFVQTNWTGPPSDMHFLPQVYRAPDKQKELLSHIDETLLMDGEPIYPLTRQPLLLYIARTILLDCRNSLSECNTSRLWLLRYLNIHQQLLQERSPTLMETVMDLIAQVQQQESSFLNDEVNRNIAIQFNCEVAHLCYFYYDHNKAKEHLVEARKLSGLEIRLTGAMGKRTRFQTSDVAQLVLNVERAEGSTPPESSLVDEESETLLPKDVTLEDETLLKTIKISNPEEVSSARLTPEEQTLILALCAENRKNNEGTGDIIQDESSAFINYVLSQPQNWSVQTAALILRCYWERHKSKKAERSLKQFEEIVNQYAREEPSASDRVHLLYAVKFPPKWETEKCLADFLMSLGAVGAALEVYERLHMWEDVIRCYQQQNRNERAEKLIREQLVVKETPQLYCYLGDATNDIQYYHKAWELSNQKSSRAQKSLAVHFFRNKEFEQAMVHFEKCLEVNALQIGAWFTYGCASMAAADYQKSATAFRRCVTLEYDNFEAWTNLSTAFVRLKNKKRAFLTLQEALKCNYENWRIWENYLVVSTDCGEFEEIIRAYHRLLDLKQKYADAQILGILVKAINENIKDSHERDSSRLRQKAQELFGRVTAAVTGDSGIWRHYAELLTGANEQTDETRQRALQYLQKSHRCVTQTVGWEMDLAKCRDVAEQSVQLGKSYEKCAAQAGSPQQAIQMLSSAKLMLRGVEAKIKQKHCDLSGALPSSLQEVYSSLEIEQQQIVSKLEQLKGA